MQRQHTDELMAALATGREQAIADAVQRRHPAPRESRPEERTAAQSHRRPSSAGLPEEAVREPSRTQESPPPMSVPRTTARDELRGALSSRQALRRAILLQEVLGPPKALQP